MSIPAPIKSRPSIRAKRFVIWARGLTRFRLRTLLLAITLICVALGVHVRRKRFDHFVAEQIRPFGGHIFYDYQVDAAENPRPSAPSPVPRWLAKFVGDDFFSRPAWLSLGSDEADDATFELIGQSTSLRVVMLDCRCVTATGIAHLAALSKLRFLDLSRTPVDDDTVTIVVGMKYLRLLRLGYTRITDRAVGELRHCTNLRYLEMQHTAITRAGYESLKVALPACTIYWSHEELAAIDKSTPGFMPCEQIRKAREERRAVLAR